MELEHINLELTLFHRSSAAEIGFFVCIYCDRKFFSPQALGGHQKYERGLAKHQRQIAAAMRAHSATMDAPLRAGGGGGGARIVVAAADDNRSSSRQGMMKKAAVVPALLDSKEIIRSLEHGYGGGAGSNDDELDLSLRL